MKSAPRCAFILPLLAGLMLSACAGTGQRISISVPADAEARMAAAKVTGDLHLPPGEGRVPVMVLLHGSGGIVADHMARYIAALNEIGVGALVVDSFSPRGIHRTGENQTALSNLAMTRDALAALDALADNPRVDRARVGVTGFSKGGTAALLAAELPFHRARADGAPRFALHVGVYPGCSWLPRRAIFTGAPIRILMGADDNYVGVEPCRAWTRRVRELGVDVAMTEYPGGHNFDGFSAHYFNRALWNFSRCRYEEQPDGSWRETTSGVDGIRRPHNVVIDPEDAQQARALAACQSQGAGGGGDQAGRALAMTDFIRIVREILRPA